MSLMFLDGALERESGRVRAMLDREADALRAAGVAVPEMEGKLLRPLVALMLVPESARDSLSMEFWSGALAIQMVHEASLLHDDILDGAAERRGRPTRAAQAGVSRALLGGDLYLTGAYRSAARADSSGFLLGFVRAVERTVAGELRQTRNRGRHLTVDQYDDILTGKSGELFGLTALLAAELGGSPVPAELGRRIGALYQRVDDLLDYCVRLPQGKPALQDWGQRKWTFVLGSAGITDWEMAPAELMRRLRSRTDGPAPLELALEQLGAHADALLNEVERAGGDTGLLGALFEAWCETARNGVSLEMQFPGSQAAAEPVARHRPPRASVAPPRPVRASDEAEVVRAARSLGHEKDWGRYFGRHSRSFRFAAWLFPSQARRHVTGIYTYCRFTDDLVDESEAPVAVTLKRLSIWGELSSAAWSGERVGVPLLDTVMPRMAEAGAPLHYVESLLEGIAMDLSPVHFDTVEELEIYSYRVASVVGGWITEQFGIHDPAVLSRACSLGHAMQMTNILRDVGEDWECDRLYIPRRSMSQHGVDTGMVDRMVRGRLRPTDAWADLTESLMQRADDHYEKAFEVLPCLPSWYARPVAVAARVYQGIHDEIRRNGYDNLGQRARTSLPTKLRLGAGGLRGLREAGLATRLRPAAGTLLSTDG